MATKKKVTLRTGSLVTWKHRGGSATGKIVKIVKTGKLKVPKSSLTLNAVEGDPAVLLRLIKNAETTQIFVGHRLSSLKAKRKH